MTGSSRPDVKERTRHDAHAWGAMVVLGAGIIAEGTRVLGSRPWPGFRPIWSHAASAVLALLWSAAIVSLLLRHRERLFARVSWFLAILAPISMLAHASVTRLGGSTVGLLYYVGAALLVFTLKRTFDRGARHRLPDGNEERDDGDDRRNLHADHPPGSKPLRPQADPADLT